MTLPPAGPRGDRGVRARRDRGGVGGVRLGLTYVNSGDGPEPPRDAVRAALAQLGDEPRILHYLSIPPAAAEKVVELLDEAGLAEGARIVMEKPFGSDLESRSRPQRHTCTSSSTRSRSSGSTTSSARRRPRTSSPCASPTASSSRSGTSTTSTTCRSTCRRRSRSATRGAFYDATGAFRDMVVTHLLQILAFVAMEPPTALDPESIRMEKIKVFRSMRELDPERVVRGQYEGYREHDGVAPDSDTETFIAMRARSTTGAGRGCPSTCGPASGWPRAGGSSRSPSASRRRACSRRARASAPTAPTTSPSTSTRARGSRSPSTARSRGRG